MRAARTRSPALRRSAATSPSPLSSSWGNMTKPKNTPAPQHPSTPAPPDQQARVRIRSELSRSLLVEAGAGSGKTHEMAARMAAGVANGTYDIEHMAAVTFTRKAAAELRGRFQLALEKELSDVGRPFRAGYNAGRDVGRGF